MKTCKHKGCTTKIEGRSDKEFCSNEHRAAYHNQIDKKLFPKFNRQVANSKLVYKCLKKLYPLSQGIKPISIKVMYENKFREDICYNAVKDSNQNGVVWFCVENYGFRQLSETEYLIEKFEE